MASSKHQFSFLSSSFLVGFLQVLLLVSSHAFTTVIPAITPTMLATRNSVVLQQASTNTDAVESDTLDTKIATAKSLLFKAAETKQEDSQAVIEALLELEQSMRQKAKLAEGDVVGKDILQALHGDWQLIFTTGTASTQEKYGKINYFPIKAVQTFRTRSENKKRITNGIFVGDFPLVKFSGDMDFDVKKRKLEFDFDTLLVLNFLKLNLGQGQAAELGAKSGLGSKSNVANAKKGRQAFFNWISADDKIATARGGGGGLALWKRIGDGSNDDE